MFAILMSAFWSVLAWVVRSVIVKFVVFFALYFITTAFTSYITSNILNSVNPTSLNGLFGNFGSDMWYFINMFCITQAITAMISAYVTRFIIRRIPVLN